MKRTTAASSGSCTTDQSLPSPRKRKDPQTLTTTAASPHTEAAAMLARLRAAIGDGPHGLTQAELDHQVQCIVVTVGDLTA